MSKLFKSPPLWAFLSSEQNLAHFTVFLLILLQNLFIWTVVLHWRPGFSIAGGDATNIELNMLRELVLGHGDAEFFKYRINLLGGSEPLASTGMAWLFQVGVWLHLPLDWALNFTYLFTQALWAYFGLEILRSLQLLWGRQSFRLTPFLFVACVTTFSFSPVLAWRIGGGHWTLISGAMVMLSMLGIVLSQLAARLTCALLLFSMLNAMAIAGSPVQQSVFYGVFFGLPILLGSVWGEVRAVRTLVLATLPVLAGYCLVSPVFSAILAHVRSSDFFRSFDKDVLVYSSLVATASDWISSLSWGTATLPPERAHWELVETNYPLGPLVLVLPLLPWMRASRLMIGTLIGIAIGLLFSLQTPIFSEFLILTVPLLKNFRIPSRALLPFALLMPVFAVSAIVYVFESAFQLSRGPAPWLLFSGFLVFFALPPEFVEISIWLALLLLVCVHILRPRKLDDLYWMPRALLVTIAAGSLLFFKLRTSEPLIDLRSRLAEAATLRTGLVNWGQAKHTSLERYWVDFENSVFGANTGQMLGVSTIQGRGFAQGRFLDLVQALEFVSYPVIVDVRVQGAAGEGARPVLQTLYNVRGSVLPMGDAGGERRLFFAPLQSESTPAWFSAKVKGMPSMVQLASQLKAIQQKGAAGLRAEMLVNQGDLRVPPKITETPINPLCMQARVDSVRVTRENQEISMDVQTPASCPLSIASNYSETLIAQASSEGGDTVELRSFPGYGALASFQVPAGTRRILVRPESHSSVWLRLVQLVGFMLMSLVIFGRHRLLRKA